MEPVNRNSLYITGSNALFSFSHPDSSRMGKNCWILQLNTQVSIRSMRFLHKGWNKCIYLILWQKSWSEHMRHVCSRFLSIWKMLGSMTVWWKEKRAFGRSRIPSGIFWMLSIWWSVYALQIHPVKGRLDGRNRSSCTPNRQPACLSAWIRHTERRWWIFPWEQNRFPWCWWQMISPQLIEVNGMRH